MIQSLYEHLSLFKLEFCIKNNSLGNVEVKDVRMLWSTSSVCVRVCACVCVCVCVCVFRYNYVLSACLLLWDLIIQSVLKCLPELEIPVSLGLVSHMLQTEANSKGRYD